MKNIIYDIICEIATIILTICIAIVILTVGSMLYYTLFVYDKDLVAANNSHLKDIADAQKENLPLTNQEIKNSIDNDGEINLGEYDKIMGVYYKEVRAKKIGEIADHEKNK